VGRPVLDIHRPAPRQLDGAVLGLGRQRDDDVETVVFQLGEGLGFVIGNVQAQLVHHRDHEGVHPLAVHVALQAARIDEGPGAVESLEQPSAIGDRTRL
jgi:hypothetical protein